MRILMRRLTLFVALAALVPPLAACGGSAPGFEGVALAAAKVEKAETMRFSVNVVEGGQIGALTGEGAIDLSQERMHVEATLPAFPTEEGAEKFEFEAIFIGRAVYVRASGLFPDSRKAWIWIEDLGEAAPVVSQFPDPSEALKMLRSAGEFEEVGTDEVRGVETTRYRGRITTDSEIAPEGSLVEAWISEDGYLRRLTFRDTSDTGTIEFYDFGADVDIEAPPSDEVATIEELSSEGDVIVVEREDTK